MARCKQTKAEKLADLRIDQAYRARCTGVTINMLDIPKVFAFGRKLVANGDNDAQLGDAIRAYVDSLNARTAR